MASLFVSDPRVQDGVEYIHEEVHDDQNDRIDDHGAHNQGIVPVECRLDEELPHSRYSEDGLYNHRTGHYPRKSGTQIADHREEGPLQYVFEHDIGFFQSFGPSRTHVVASKDFEDTGTAQSGDVGKVWKRKGEGRHDEGRPPGSARDPAGRGQDFPLEGEEKHEHGPDDEKGNRDAYDRKGHGQVIHPRVLLYGGDHAGPDTEEHGHAEGYKAQKEGVRKACEDIKIDVVVLVSKRRAQVPPENIQEITSILDDQGLIHMIFLFDVFEDLLGQSFFSIERPARRNPDNEEAYCDDDKERGNQADKPADDVFCQSNPLERDYRKRISLPHGIIIGRVTQ